MSSKVVVTMFVSLDGVTESPEKWSFQFWNDEISQLKHDELFAAGSLLMGRVTYEGFFAAWPDRAGDPFADRINALPKHVATTTLSDLEWSNSHKIQGDVVAQIKALRQEDGGDILMYGGTGMVKTLVDNDLVDEFSLLVFPIVLGSGKRLFEDGSKASLKLVESKAYASGVVLLRYEPARGA
jgi:dihydrofolate reductase